MNNTLLEEAERKAFIEGDVEKQALFARFFEPIDDFRADVDYWKDESYRLQKELDSSEEECSRLLAWIDE